METRRWKDYLRAHCFDSAIMGNNILRLKNKQENCKLKKIQAITEQIQQLLTCSESDVKYEKWPEGSNDDTFEEPLIPGDSDKECDILNKLRKN